MIGRRGNSHPAQSCDREIDGQHGHIISPGQDSHLPAEHSYRPEFPTMHVKI
jgi:hypothetical protein